MVCILRHLPFKILAIKPTAAFFWQTAYKHLWWERENVLAGCEYFAKQQRVLWYPSASYCFLIFPNMFSSMAFSMGFQPVRPCSPCYSAVLPAWQSAPWQSPASSHRPTPAGGNEDSSCHFDLTLNSRGCSIIDGCDTFCFCWNTLRCLAQSWKECEEICAQPSRAFCCQQPGLGFSKPGAGLGWEAWGRGVRSTLVLGTGAVGEQSYRPGVFRCHWGRGKMRFPSHGGKWSIPKTASVCAKGRVSGVRGKGITWASPVSCSVWAHMNISFWKMWCSLKGNCFQWKQAYRLAAK